MKNNEPIKQFAARKFISWFFQVKSTEKIMIGSSLAVLMAVAGGNFLFPFLIAQINEVLPPEFQATIEMIDNIVKWIVFIASVVLVIGVVLVIMKFKREMALENKKRVIVVEARGLRDDDGSSLIDALPPSITGQKIPILLDLRQRQDGMIIAPKRLIHEVEATHRSILQHKKSHDRDNLSTIYGGLTSVPLTFLTGILFDDESSLVTYDWNRDDEEWQVIGDRDDDKEEFVISGLDDITSESDVVLSISFSYLITTASIESSITYPVVSLRMQNAPLSDHWSLDKQRRLSHDFVNVIKKMTARGVERIHLTMAAPNSVVFHFGRKYDKRNFPEIIVYQFENGKKTEYPWGVSMPVAALQAASVVHVNQV